MEQIDLLNIRCENTLWPVQELELFNLREKYMTVHDTILQFSRLGHVYILEPPPRECNSRVLIARAGIACY